MMRPKDYLLIFLAVIVCLFQAGSSSMAAEPGNDAPAVTEDIRAPVSAPPAKEDLQGQLNTINGIHIGNQKAIATLKKAQTYINDLIKGIQADDAELNSAYQSASKQLSDLDKAKAEKKKKK
jgi:hypothetical protein